MDPIRNEKGPHIRHEDTTRSLMLDVCIALLPALIWGVYVFGLRALVIAVISVFFSVGSEALIEVILKRPITVADGSAVVSGLILALSMPVSVPLWIVPIGAVFATVITKALFGGLGRNWVNPALSARILLFAAFSRFITRQTEPFAGISPLQIHPKSSSLADLISQKTPLDLLRGEPLDEHLSLSALFSGTTAGAIGEVSAILLLAGLLYLLVRKVVSWYIPAGFLGTVLLFGLIFPNGHSPIEGALLSVLCGGVIFVAVFCATDPVTSPITPWGKLAFGILCGLITSLFRLFGIYHEASAFAVLIANFASIPLDLLFPPRAFGTKLTFFWKRK